MFYKCLTSYQPTQEKSEKLLFHCFILFTFDSSKKTIVMTLFITLILGLGGQEITLIVVVLLLFFGGKKLPELARGLGKGIKEFKDASKGEEKKGEEKKEIEGGN